MHNTQPWRFRILRADQTIELFADPSRMLKHADPPGRAAHIACGLPCSTCAWRSRWPAASR
jgi:hypothetical protein